MKRCSNSVIVSLLTFLLLVVPVFAGSTLNGGSVHLLGSKDALIIKPDKTLWGKGQNTSGSLGLGHQNEVTSFAQIAEDVVYVNSECWATFFIKSDGSLWAMGYNEYGALGLGHMKPTMVPTKVMDGVKKVATSGYHTFAIKTDGSLWGWGFNRAGELGKGDCLGNNTNSWAEMEQLTNDLDLMLAWDKVQSKPVKIMDGVKDVYLMGSGYYGGISYILKENGEVYCCGMEEQQGVTKLILTDIAQVDYFNPFADSQYYLKTDHTLWGKGIPARLGIASTETTELIDTPILLMNDIKAVSSSGTETLVIKQDGSLWGWGLNHDAQLAHNGKGDWTTTYFRVIAFGEVYGQECEDFIYQTTPIKIMDDVAQILQSGLGGTYVVKTDGSLWGWGNIVENPWNIKISDQMTYDYQLADLRNINEKWQVIVHPERMQGIKTRQLTPIKITDLYY